MLFDDLYFDLLIETGKRDALDWLERHPDFWCSEAGHDFDFDTGRVPAGDGDGRRRRSSDAAPQAAGATDERGRRYRRRSTDRAGDDDGGATVAA